MAKFKDLNQYVTPRAEVTGFTYLHAPDTKFAKGGSKGDYKVSLKMDPEAYAQLEEMLAPDFAAAKALVPDKYKNLKNKPRVRPLGTELEDGSFEVGTFKMMAGGVREDGTAWEQRPFVFDAKKNPLPEGTRIGAGSVVRVAFRAKPYFNATGEPTYGVSLKLEAVQVLKLVEFQEGGRSASAFGFEEEDGYVRDEMTARFGDEDEGDGFGDDFGDENDYSAEDF